jgi:CRISPR/Cas system CSM-associated protein Csm3 (group 7 of RAMP superfamily)
MLFEGLMKSYKQFFDILGEHYPQPEAQQRYEEYKKEYNKRNSRTFFNEHCKEEWFKERYHPDWMKKRRETKIERAKIEAKLFAEELVQGTLKYSLSADEYPHLVSKTSCKPLTL